MAAKAIEFPVLFNGRAATLSFGETAIRLFDRTSFAMFKTFPDPSAVELRVEGEALVLDDGVEHITVASDGVAAEKMLEKSGVAGRPLRSEAAHAIPLATAPSIAGRSVLRTFGVVSGSAVVSGEGIASLPKGSLRVFDGRSERYQQDLSTGLRTAFAGMRAQAETGGANGVVSVAVEHTPIGEELILIVATGTAVRLD
jgi:uncharacterized protein YbjQ (UPF0145 family)